MLLSKTIAWIELATQRLWILDNVNHTAIFAHLQAI